MGVTCQILINKPREGVHMARSVVSGTVKYAIKKPTKYKDVTLSFLGKGECWWEEQRGKFSASYKGTESYIDYQVNIIEKKPEDTITLHGEYEYPFEFYLPENIPTSYKESKYLIASIVYYIELKFVKSSIFSFKKVFTAEIPVQGNTGLTTPDGVSLSDVPIHFGLRKNLFTPLVTKTPVIILSAAIMKTCFTPGENVLLSYVVTNQSDVKITSVCSELYCYMTYTANCGRVTESSFKIKKCDTESLAVPPREVSNFTCTLPTLPNLYSIQNTKIIKREYKIRLTVRLPRPHNDAVVEMPIVIAERKVCAELCVEASGEALETQLPGYWEAMSEEKETEKENSDLDVKCGYNESGDIYV